MSFYLISEHPHGDVSARIMRKNEAHHIERPISGVFFYQVHTLGCNGGSS